MLTIENVSKLLYARLKDEWIVKTVEVEEQRYIFEVSKTIKVINPHTFMPMDRELNIEIRLSRTTSVLTPEDYSLYYYDGTQAVKGIYVRKHHIDSLDLFIEKLNYLIG